MIISRYRVVRQPFLDHQDGIANAWCLPRERAIGGPSTWTPGIVLKAAILPPCLRRFSRILTDVEVLLPAEEDELAVVLQRNQTASDLDDVLWLVVEPPRNAKWIAIIVDSSMRTRRSPPPTRIA